MPETRGFQDRYQDILDCDVNDVYGLSVQSTSYQREARDRLDLPFELLSDTSLEFASGLSLPTFEAGGERLLKRLTFIVRDGRYQTRVLSRLPTRRTRGRGAHVATFTLHSGTGKDKIPSLRLSIEPIGGERLDRFVGIAGQDELSEVCSDTRCQRDP